MREYIDKDFEELLRQNQMVSFDKIWNLPKDWFEEPNIRRNGWSGVSLHTLNNMNTKPLRIVIKRQENHQFRSIMHPLGRPTFYKEYKNIMALEKRNIPSLKAIYYGERRIDSRYQAILITLVLENYLSLNDLGKNDKRLNPEIVTKLARLVRTFHDAGFQHRSLYGKHILVKTDGTSGNHPDIRLIDLEKMRRGLTTSTKRSRDVSQLIRHSESLSKEDIKLFLHSYLTDNPAWGHEFLLKLKSRTSRKLKASAKRSSTSIENLIS